MYKVNAKKFLEETRKVINEISKCKVRKAVLAVFANEFEMEGFDLKNDEFVFYSKNKPKLNIKRAKWPGFDDYAYIKTKGMKWYCSMNQKFGMITTSAIAKYSNFNICGTCDQFKLIKFILNCSSTWPKLNKIYDKIVEIFESCIEKCEDIEIPNTNETKYIDLGEEEWQERTNKKSLKRTYKTVKLYKIPKEHLEEVYELVKTWQEPKYYTW